MMQVFQRFAVFPVTEAILQNEPQNVDQGPVVLDFEGTNSAMPAVALTHGWGYVAAHQSGSLEEIQRILSAGGLLESMSIENTALQPANKQRRPQNTELSGNNFSLLASEKKDKMAKRKKKQNQVTRDGKKKPQKIAGRRSQCHALH